MSEVPRLSYITLECERCDEDFYVCEHLGTVLDRQVHYVEFTTDDWVLEHPVKCRTRAGGLLACPLNEELKTIAPPTPGRYVIDDVLYDMTGMVRCTNQEQ